MSNSIDIDVELSRGSKSPEAVFAEMNALIDAALTPTADISTAGKNYNGLRSDSKVIKNVFGNLKEPVAARLSVIDMATSEYIVTSTRFILTAVNISSSEKFQVTYSFDEEWLFSVFGKEVPIYDISGILINFKSPHDWTKDFKELYENYMRAYVLVKNKWMAVLHYSNRWIRGYPIFYSNMASSETETFAPFSMRMVVRKDKMY